MKDFNQQELCEIATKAKSMAEHANIAFWIINTDANIDYHLESVEERFKEIAEMMGYEKAEDK